MNKLPVPLYVALGFAAGLIILVIYMFARGDKRRPSRLNLKAFSSLHEGQASSDRKKASRAREINVLIEFNGKKYDAFEVLDLPAGSSMDNIERSYANKSQILRGVERIKIKKAYQALKNLS